MKFCRIDDDMQRRYAECMHELEVLKEYGEFINGRIDLSDEEKVALAKDCEVVFFGSTFLRNEIIEQLPALECLQFIGTGVANYVDVVFCEKRGIKVLNVEDYGSNSVAEYTLALILCCLRGVSEADAQMKKSVWAPEQFEGEEIEGSVVGVLGTGKIGSRVARKLKLLGAAEVLAFDVFENEQLKKEYGVHYAALEEIFERSDIITVHLKYTPETFQIINKDLLEKMKPTASFVNAARAELVDYVALQAMLEQKRIRAAAVDVFYREPVEDYSLCRLNNVIATPHLGFFSKKAKCNLVRGAVNSVVDYVKGREGL